jgi:aryl-alcohol dehydrogenase-like predicted oxidoreductase
MFIGEWAEKRGIRNELVIASKVFFDASTESICSHNIVFNYSTQ